MIESWIANDPASGGPTRQSRVSVQRVNLWTRTPVMASVELLYELLSAIVDVLDARDVFPRISQAARELLQRVAPAVRERER